jgi:hypothetical protein
MSEVGGEDIFKIISSKNKMPSSFAKQLLSEKVSAAEMPINTYKKRVIGIFVEYFYNE